MDKLKARQPQVAAGDLILSALSFDPEETVLGNVSAFELARIAAYVLDRFSTACPSCDAEPGANIDCDVCRVWPLLVPHEDGQ